MKLYCSAAAAAVCCGRAAQRSREASNAAPTAAAAAGRPSANERRAMHTAYTMGSPVISRQAAPKSQ